MPYHLMTQGKIEHYHPSMKNVVTLQINNLPKELKREIEQFVDYFNSRRYHESLDNLAPADVYKGKNREKLREREEIKQSTIRQRSWKNLQALHYKNHLLTFN
jgi:transposase InsO family protein